MSQGGSIGGGGSGPTTPMATFLAHKSANTANATGDSTQLAMVCDTVDVNSGFTYNNTTGVITCVTTGFYQFNCSVGLSNLTLGLGVFIFWIGSVYQMAAAQYDVGNVAVTSANQIISSWAIPMTAGDTMQVLINVQGGTKTVGISGGVITGFAGPRCTLSVAQVA